MPKQNPFIVKLPETFTVSYYDAETDQNLTAEEWKQLHSETNPSEVRITNQGEVYASWKADVDYSAYGPMPFFDEANALIVARSQEIVSELRRNYPTIVQLLNHNRKGTLAFLKANDALFFHEVIHEFSVSSGSDSWYGPEVWRQYKGEINNYVDKLCKNLIDRNGKIVDRELFRLAREALADHIHSEYKRELPRWPLPFCENTASIRVEISGSYHSNTNYYVVWSCSGSIDIRDENRGFCDFHARFRGSPEVKVLILDFDKLGEIERDFKDDVRAAERFIDRKEIEYRNERPNLLEYWDRKYI